jgi:hypothetical protein
MASATPTNLISVEQDLCPLAVLFVMPAEVELLQSIDVDGYGCPISSSVSKKNVVCLQLRKSVPSLALAVEGTTNCNIAHRVKNAPFNLMGFVGSERQPMKKC